MLHVLPTLWFRNTWSWADEPGRPRPLLRRRPGTPAVIRAEHHELGAFDLHAEAGADLLFCENETNAARLWGAERHDPFAKDGIGDYLAAWRGHGQPGTHRNQGRRARPARPCRPAAGAVLVRLDRWRTRAGWRPRSPVPRTCSWRAGRKQTSSTTRSRRLA